MTWKRCTIVLGVVWPQFASAAPDIGTFAYVDPGAGSFLLQALLAALAGIIVTVNIYWRKIKTFFGTPPDPDDPDNPPRDGADE